MKCEQFLNLVYEYVEGTLSPKTRLAADEHLAQCEVCRGAVQSEEILAQALSRGLHQSAETLTLGPQAARRVLAGLQRGRNDVRGLAAFVRSWSRWVWVGGATVSILAAVWLAGILSSRSHKLDRTVENGNVAAQTIVSVHSSYVVPVYHFSQEDGMVTDSLEFRTNIVDLTMWADAKPDRRNSQERTKEL